MKRIKIVKVFADKVKSTLFLKNPLGSRKPLLNQSDVQAFADGEVEKGFEAIKGEVGFGDVSNMLWYVTALIRHIYDRGIPEFSPYETYKAGAVVSHDGKLWVTHQNVEPSIVIKESAPDPCNCCQTTMIEDGYPLYPSKETGWCYLVDSCEFYEHIDRLDEKDKAIIKMVEDLKGVEAFSILPNKTTGALELNLELSDGSHLVIPMTKFGHIEQNKDGTLSITNANGTTLELPKYVAEHDLDQQKGFYYNTASDKWEVDLRDLVKNGSGLEVDREGYVSVKPADFIDNNSLEILPTGKTGVSESWLSRILNPLKDYITNQKDANANALAEAISNLEAAQKAYVDEKAKEAEVLARGSYAEIKAYQENLEALKQQVSKHENDLGNQADQLKALGLTDEEILALIQAGMNKANPNYITRIDSVDGGVKVTYANGTTAILSGNAVAVDGKSIVGNGKDTVLSVQLSKNSDNKLQLVNDGLYLGDSVIQPYLYVVSTGDDANIGTREKPMRTLKAALERIPDGYTGEFNIYLKENEEFEIGGMYFKSCRLVIQAYGDLVDSTYPAANEHTLYYRGYLAKDYPRPQINVRVRKGTRQVIRDGIICTKQLVVLGIAINVYHLVENDDANLNGSFFGVFGSDLRTIVLGCTIDQKTKAVPLTGNGVYRYDAFFRGPIVEWNCSKVLNPIMLISPLYTAQVYLDSWGNLAGLIGTVQQFEPLVSNSTAMEEVTKYWKAGSRININEASQLTYGVSYNINMFTIHTDEQWGSAN